MNNLSKKFKEGQGTWIKKSLAPLSSLIWNFALVYIISFVCRIAFLGENYVYYADQLNSSLLWSIFKGGLRFDTTAILYTNVLYILLVLFPLHYKENHLYQKVTKWLFVITNSIALVSNLMDAVYFQYTNRRTTATFFKEFSNENNLFSIVGKEMVQHWYLVFLAILIIIILSKGYKYIKSYPTNKLLPYYCTQILIFAFAIPLCIAGMRGGFTTATRPITISNANQYVNRPIETALVLNTPFSIYRTLDKEVFKVPSYFNDREEMLSIYSPIHIPNTQKSFKKKNVVIFIMESFGKEYFGCFNKELKGEDYGYTPFLDSLITKSVIYEHSFANGRKSIDGMPSVLSSIPMFVEPFFVTPSSLNTVTSIGGELKKKGYYTAFFHGAEDGSMGFQAYARTSGFTHYFGRSEYNNDDDFDGTWAIWDRNFFEYYADEITKMKEPFAVGLFSATSHHPFRIPKEDVNTFAEGTMPIHKCIRYSDNALRSFFNKAKKEAWYNNTIFVITADHTNKGDTPEYMTDAGRYEIPIIFFCPSDSTMVGNRPGISQQIDIMPTVLNYLGYNEPYIAFGCDLLNTPAEKTFAVNFNNGIYQYFKGNLFLQYDGTKCIALYDYVNDRMLKNNLLNEYPAQAASMKRELQAIIQQYMERMTQNQLTYTE